MTPSRRTVLAAVAFVAATGAAIAAKPAPRSAGTAPAAAPRELAEDDLDALAFRSIGPANMGGRVAAIALVPGSRTSFYVGFATGGLFRTENLGVTWTSLFDEQKGLSIGSIAVADAPASWRGWAPQGIEEKDRAAKGKGRIVWVGTGEGNGRNSSSWGHGVFRSTDGGETFDFLGLAESHDVPAIALDPRDPDVAYVAALGHLWGANPERGVFKTADGGATWKHVLRIDDAHGACDVHVDPKRPDTVFAAMYARRRTPWSFRGTSEAGGLFRSDDGGATWTKLSGGLPGRTGRIGIALYANDPSIVYAVVESDEGGAGKAPFSDRSPRGGVFRSEDRGASWVRVSDLNPRPFYFSRIVVDPADDRRVYLPGWDLAISDDGGRTFRRSGSQLVHVDHHAMVVNPLDTNQLILGNDGGVYLSHDRAKSWDFLNNLAVGQFYRISVDMADPYHVAGGLQDNGSWIGPSATLFVTEDDSKDGILNEDWTTIFGWDGFGVAFDPVDPNVVYATGQGGELIRIHRDTKVMRALKPSPREGQERLRFNWNAPFFVSEHDPATLYLGGNRVFKLTARGDFWTAISGDLSRRDPDRIQTVGSDAETFGTVVALAESPKRAGLLWAGTDDGRIWVTEDGGGGWREATPAAVGGLYVSSIAASRHDALTAYATIDGHRSDVFKPLVLATRDLGKTWTDITGSLPAGHVAKMVKEDPDAADVLYCGTEFGAFVTLDRGRRWVRLNGKSLPPAPADDLIVHPRERDLVVATHGRSVWILDDASIFGRLTPEVRRWPLAALKPRPAKPRLLAGRAYGAGAGIFRAKNPPQGAILNFWVSDRAGEPVKLTIADASGLEVRSLETTSRRGINRVVWDLRADAKHRFVDHDEALLGQASFVPPGDYKVSIALGKERAETLLTVLPAPEPTFAPIRGED